MTAARGVTIPEPFQRFEHPTVTWELAQVVERQLHEDISIYDNRGIYSKLERGFERWHGVRNALSVTSGTAALFTMFYSLNLERGSEVIVPSYTFFATATPLILLGLVPVFADCDDCGNLDPGEIDRLVGPRTRAVIMTHMWGIPCQIAEILSEARKHNLLVLEDASHAHGAKAAGHMVGTQTDGTAWSLQGKKNLPAGEGGIYATPHTELYERAVLLGHFNKRAKLEVHSDALSQFAITGSGLNLRMHPLGAAIAYHFLQRQDEILKEKREVAKYLMEALREFDGLVVPPISEECEPAWYAFPILYDSSKFGGLAKEEFVAALVAEGAQETDIPNSTCPIHRYELFRNTAGVHATAFGAARNFACDFPKADDFHARLLKLPVWYGPLRWEYAKYHVEALKKVWYTSKT